MADSPVAIVARKLTQALTRSPRGVHISRCEGAVWLDLLNTYLEEIGHDSGHTARN